MANEKHTEELKTQLGCEYMREFALRPHDGVLMVIKNEAYHKITPQESIFCEANSLGNIGHASIQLFPSAALSPLFPTNATFEKKKTVNISHGERFMQRTLILSGARHVDKSDEVIKDAHEYDDAIVTLCTSMRERGWTNQALSLSNLVGADLIDYSDQGVGDIMFEEHFPEIPVDQRAEYVMLFVCHTKAAIEYILGNMHVACPSAENSSSNSLRVLPHTYVVETDNERLNQTSALCRLLVCNDDSILVNPCGSENKDTVLIDINRSLSNAMCDSLDECTKLKDSLTLWSLLVSAVMYEHPTPFSLPYDEKRSSADLLIERLYLIDEWYVIGKHNMRVKVGASDQFACVALGVMQSCGISPSFLKTCRSDKSQLKDSGAPWPDSIANCIKTNIDQDNQDEMEDDNDQKSTADEIMILAHMELLTLFSYRDHIFHADTFKNPEELSTRTGNGTAENPSLADLKKLKIKPLCSQTMFNHGLSIVENILCRFHFDPILFKRYFVLNSLHVLGGRDLVRLNDSIEESPVPNSIQIINSTGVPRETNAVYECVSCGKVPFYQKNRSHCFCFLLLKVFAKLTQNQMNNLKEVKTIHSAACGLKCNHTYEGSMTSCKTIHSFVSDEVRSSVGHFGQIALSHPDRNFRRKNEDVQDQVQTQVLNTFIDKDAEYKAKSQKAKKMDILLYQVKRNMGRRATLTDPEYVKEQPQGYLCQVQRQWTDASDPQDFSPFTTGAEDDIIARCLKQMHKEPVKPFLITDSAPAHDQQEQQENRKRYNLGKRRCSDNWEDQEQVTPAKIQKSECLEKMEEFVKSFLYKVFKNDQINQEWELNPCHNDIVAMFKNDRKRTSQQFFSVLTNYLIGTPKSSTVTVKGNSLIPRLVESYLERIPEFIKEVHSNVADILHMSPNELEKEFSEIWHVSDRPKRELVAWNDFYTVGSQQRRSVML